MTPSPHLLALTAVEVFDTTFTPAYGAALEVARRAPPAR